MLSRGTGILNYLKFRFSLGAGVVETSALRAVPGLNLSRWRLAHRGVHGLNIK